MKPYIVILAFVTLAAIGLTRGIYVGERGKAQWTRSEDINPGTPLAIPGERRAAKSPECMYLLFRGFRFKEFDNTESCRWFLD